MDGNAEMTLCICKVVPSIIALAPVGSEEYHKVNESYRIVIEAKNIGQIHIGMAVMK